MTYLCSLVVRKRKLFEVFLKRQTVFKRAGCTCNIQCSQLSPEPNCERCCDEPLATPDREDCFFFFFRLGETSVTRMPPQSDHESCRPLHTSENQTAADHSVPSCALCRQQSLRSHVAEALHSHLVESGL